MPKAAADTNKTDRGEAGAQLRRRFAPAIFSPDIPWHALAVRQVRFRKATTPDPVRGLRALAGFLTPDVPSWDVARTRQGIRRKRQAADSGLKRAMIPARTGTRFDQDS